MLDLVPFSVPSTKSFGPTTPRHITQMGDDARSEHVQTSRNGGGVLGAFSNRTKLPEAKTPSRTEAHRFRFSRPKKQQGVSGGLDATPQTGRSTYSCNQVPISAPAIGGSCRYHDTAMREARPEGSCGAT